MSDPPTEKQIPAATEKWVRADPAPVPVINGAEWLTAGLRETAKNKLASGWNNPQGELRCPPHTYIECDEALMIPVRHSIIGGQEITSTSTPGFIASKKFKGAYLIRQDVGYQQQKRKNPNYNHPSGATYRFITCYGAGLFFGGAQQTTVEHLTVMGWTEDGYGLLVMPGSHTFAARDLYLSGSPTTRATPLTALRLYKCGASVDSAKLHRVSQALSIYSSHDCLLTNLHLEHVGSEKPAIAVTEGSSNIEIRASVQHYGRVVLDLTKARQVHIQMRLFRPYFAKHPAQLIDRDGSLVEFAAIPAKGNGRVVRVWLDSRTGGKAKWEIL